MQSLRLFVWLMIGLLIVCAAALCACLGLSRLLRSPITLFLGDDQRLTYLDLAHHASLTTKESVTLGPQHTMMVSPNGRYIFNQNAPYTLYDSYQGRLSTLSIPNVCVKFQLSDRYVSCIDVQSLHWIDLDTHDSSNALINAQVIDYRWTVDGKGVVFTEWNDQQTDLFIAASLSATPRRIASMTGHVYLDSLSPDGRYALGLDNSAGHRNLVLVDLSDGSTQVMAYDPAAANARITALIWSPDSQNVAVFASEGAATTLADPIPSMILNIDNGSFTPLSDDTGDASWSPNGSRLLYLALNRFGAGNLLRAYFVVQANGGDKVSIAQNPTGSYFWAPGGDTIDVIRQGKIYELSMSNERLVPNASWTISTSAVPTVKFYWR